MIKSNNLKVELWTMAANVQSTSSSLRPSNLLYARACTRKLQRIDPIWAKPQTEVCRTAREVSPKSAARVRSVSTGL